MSSFLDPVAHSEVWGGEIYRAQPPHSKVGLSEEQFVVARSDQSGTILVFINHTVNFCIYQKITTNQN